jgi:hypothetical protein
VWQPLASALHCRAQNSRASGEGSTRNALSLPPRAPRSRQIPGLLSPSHAYLSSPPPKLSRLHLFSITSTRPPKRKRKRNRRRTYSQLVTQTFALNTKNNNTRSFFQRISTRRSYESLPNVVTQLLSINNLGPLQTITTLVDTQESSSAMAPMNNQNLNYSSNYGEAAAQKVNVLASCYLVDSSASLKGLHYCTTGVAGTLYSLLHTMSFLSRS